LIASGFISSPRYLQLLRYAQKFGTYEYTEINKMYQTYKNDMIEKEVQYSWDKDEKKWYKNYEQIYFYNE